MGFCSYRAVEPLAEQLHSVGASTNLDEARIKDAAYVPEHELRPWWLSEGLFSWWKSLGSATVALFVLFDNLCPIMD
jgi:hypothetical protein